MNECNVVFFSSFDYSSINYTNKLIDCEVWLPDQSRDRERMFSAVKLSYNTPIIRTCIKGKQKIYYVVDMNIPASIATIMKRHS